MGRVINSMRPFIPVKVIAMGTAGLMAAGCSSEVTRFSAPLFGGSSQTQYTGSVSPAPTAAIEQSPLGDPSGRAPYQSPAMAPMGTGLDLRPAASGGSTIVAQSGDTAHSIARRYGVPDAALMQANGLSDPYAVRAGQEIIIPAYSHSTASWQKPAAGPSGQYQVAALPTPPSPQPDTQPVAPRQSGTAHTVRPGETVYSIARAYSASPHDIISSNGLSSPNNIRIGQSLTIPGARSPSAAAQSSGSASPTVAKPAEPAPTQMALAAPAGQPAQPDAGRTREEPKPTHAAYSSPSDAEGGAAQSRAGLPEPAALSAGKFRWPVRGRVISSFGDKSEGGKNDGVTISVPEGTSVRAAENGVVAYAGNELKGYGNLVLIRHADNWVTAYAHNSELNVKRGDVITRGQVIAKAGQTGSVSSPQLHFELRKGSQPVDPLSYLSED